MHNQHIAAQPKRPSEDARADAPVQQPMRAGQKIRRNPSTDQLKVRRQMARSASLRRTATSYNHAYVIGYSDAEKDRVDYPYVSGSELARGYADGVKQFRSGQPVPAGIRAGAESWETEMEEEWERERGFDFFGDSDPAYILASRRKTAFGQELIPGKFYVTDRDGSIMSGPYDNRDDGRKLFALGPEFARIIEIDANGQRKTAAETTLESDTVLEEGTDDMDAVVAARRAMFPGATASAKLMRTHASLPKLAWTMEQLQARIDSGSFSTTIDGDQIDNFSAGTLMSVMKALNPENQAKMMSFNIQQAALVAFKLVNKSKSAGRLASLHVEANSFLSDMWAELDAMEVQIEDGDFNTADALIKGIGTFWPGDGAELSGALMSGGWSVNFIDGDYNWTATAPGGGTIAYTEGDISKVGARRTAAGTVTAAHEWDQDRLGAPLGHEGYTTIFNGYPLSVHKWPSDAVYRWTVGAGDDQGSSDLQSGTAAVLMDAMAAAQAIAKTFPPGPLPEGTKSYYASKTAAGTATADPYAPSKMTCPSCGYDEMHVFVYTNADGSQTLEAECDAIDCNWTGTKHKPAPTTASRHEAEYDHFTDALDEARKNGGGSIVQDGEGEWFAQEGGGEQVAFVNPDGSWKPIGGEVIGSRHTAGGPYHQWYSITQTVGSPAYDREAFEYQDDYAKVTVQPFQREPGVTEGWSAIVTQTDYPGFSWGQIGQASWYGPFPTKEDAMREGLLGIRDRGLSSVGSKTANEYMGYDDDTLMPDSMATSGEEPFVTNSAATTTARRHVAFGGDSDKWYVFDAEAGDVPVEGPWDTLEEARSKAGLPPNSMRYYLGTGFPDLSHLTGHEASSTGDPSEERSPLPTDETWLDNEGNFQRSAALDVELRSIIKEQK